jgi:hypothetical protein
VVHPDKYDKTARACIGSRFAPFAIDGQIPAKTDQDSKWPTIGLNTSWQQSASSTNSNSTNPDTDQVCLYDSKKDEMKCEVCTFEASADFSTFEKPWTDKKVYKDWMKVNTDKCDKIKDQQSTSNKDQTQASNEKQVSEFAITDPECKVYVDNNLLSVPLSNNYSAMKTQLNAAKPVQLTNIALSLDAAWYQLKNAAVDPDSNRFLVLLTDGVQTVPGYRFAGNSSRGPGNNEKYTISDAESNTEDLCTNIKSDGINIISIAFQLNNQSTRNRLKNCASNSNFYFEAESNNQLAAVFEEIIGLTKNQVYLRK